MGNNQAYKVQTLNDQISKLKLQLKTKNEGYQKSMKQADSSLKAIQTRLDNKQKQEKRKDKEAEQIKTKKAEKEIKDLNEIMKQKDTTINQIIATNLSNQSKIQNLSSQNQSIMKTMEQKQKQAATKQSQLQNQLNELKTASQAQLENMRDQLQSIHDPKKMKQHIDVMKQIFWNDLKQKQFELHPGKSVIFIGRTSVGKSSLINTLFKTNAKTSKSRCTKQISILRSFGQGNGAVTIFDCPGLDQHFDLVKDPYKIPTYMGAMSDIYYLYDGFIQPDIVKTFMAMGKRIFAVRTKCDPDQAPEENEEVRADDYSQLSQIDCPTEIFLTSKKQGQDNARLIQHIMTPIVKVKSS